MSKTVKACIQLVDKCGDIAQRVGACKESASSAFGRSQPSAAGDTDGKGDQELCSHPSRRRGRAGATDPRSSGRQLRGHRTQPKTAQSSAPPPPKHPHPAAAGAQGARSRGPTGGTAATAAPQPGGLAPPPALPPLRWRQPDRSPTAAGSSLPFFGG